MGRGEVDSRFGERMRALLDARGISYRALAARVYQSKSHLNDIANGRKLPTLEIARRLDEVLGAGGELVALAREPIVEPSAVADDAEVEAIELARRIEASDVSDGTLARLEQVTDRLAMAYAGAPPHELLPRVRRHLGYVTGLTEARMTLVQRRRLLVTGGWLALLAATLHIDLRQREAAEMWLTTAEQ